MADGLMEWMGQKGYETLDDFRGLSLPNMREWKDLNLNYKVVARIHESKCIGCELCYTACWDGAHQCIHLDRTLPAPNHHITPDMITAQSRGRITSTPIPKLDFSGPGGIDGPYRTPLSRIPRVDEAECVGCNLCSLVCPVEDCITMERIDNGLLPETWAERAGAGTIRDIPEGMGQTGNRNQ